MKYHFQCVNCNTEYQPGEVTYLCPKCDLENGVGKPQKGILKVIYPYNELKKDPKKIVENHFLDLLPIKDLNSLSPLNVGHTPLYHKDGPLSFKFDALNPTFSFKDRASDLVSAVAKESNLDTIVTASTGNAASSLAGICASQDQKAILFVPAAAPRAKLIQILMYGGVIVPVDGTYDDAFDLSLEATEKFGWYNRNTGYNPFTIEGKKSVSFELYHQFEGNLPDRIYVPTGDGVIMSGLYKGLEDLLLCGLIDKMPEVVAVQAEGSANLTNNLDRDEPQFEGSNTVADSISVDIPRNFFMARDFIKKYNGRGLKVSDQSILDASLEMSRKYGLFAEPASAAAYAGYLALQKEAPVAREMVLLTGSGLKDIATVEQVVSLPKPIAKNVDAVATLLKEHYNL